jgi:hypothetical protein
MREWEQKYGQHKHRAGRRGIPFELTFEQWLKIWQDSGHLRERGHRQGQYVMARFFGRGSYKIGNVQIILAEDNNHFEAADGNVREQVHTELGVGACWYCGCFGGRRYDSPPPVQGKIHLRRRQRRREPEDRRHRNRDR